MITFGLAIAALACTFLGPALAHFEVIRPLPGLLLFVLGGGLGVVAASLAFLAAARNKASRLTHFGFWGLVSAALLLGASLPALHYPAINDVSTNLDDPPAFFYAAQQPQNRDKDLSFPQEFISDIRASYSDLVSLVVPAPPAQVYEAAYGLAQEMPGWEITYQDPEANLFEGIATTWLFRFQEDFVVRIRQGQDEETSVVDMRSRSRVGKGDLGSNAARIRSFLERLRYDYD